MINIKDIKRRRVALGMSLADAAIKAGWGYAGRTRWHDIESGRRKGLTLKTISEVAAALGVTVNTLLTKD